jgi:hypothetical protein
MVEKSADNRGNHLLELIRQMNESTSANGRKYFHFQTIQNIIIHYDEIKTQNDKEWVYNSLLQYFAACKELGPAIDRNTSKMLFYEYVDNLADYYGKNLGFSLMLNRTVIYFFYFLCLLLTYIFVNVYVMLVLASLFIYHIGTQYLKYKRRRVYSIFF